MTTVYQNAMTDTVTSDWRGTRHARITPFMKALPPAHLKVLTELRYRLCDGESAQISNATLAQATGLSEGYISVIMRQLAGESVSMKRIDPARPPATGIPI